MVQVIIHGSNAKVKLRKNRARPVNEHLNAIIIIRLSIKLSLLGGIKRGVPNMRVPLSGTRFPEEPKIENY